MHTPKDKVVAYMIVSALVVMVVNMLVRAVTGSFA
jgi:hypothetical protein